MAMNDFIRSGDGSARSDGQTRYIVARFADVPAVACPCGEARRAFAVAGNDVATMHVVEISATSRTHYHKRTTELYFVLAGEGVLELDGDRIELSPMTAVLIRPGCRHRAIPTHASGLRILNVPVPAFDTEDEWFD